MELERLIGHAIKRKAINEAKKELEKRYKTTFEKVSFIDVLTEKCIFVGEKGNEILSITGITQEFNSLVAMKMHGLECKLTDYLMKTLNEIIENNL